MDTVLARENLSAGFQLVLIAEDGAVNELALADNLEAAGYAVAGALHM